MNPEFIELVRSYRQVEKALAKHWNDHDAVRQKQLAGRIDAAISAYDTDAGGPDLFQTYHDDKGDINDPRR